MKHLSEGISMGIAKVRSSGELITTDMVINNANFKKQILICHDCKKKETIVVFSKGYSYAFFRRLGGESHEDDCRYRSSLNFLRSSVLDINSSNSDIQIKLRIINDDADPTNFRTFTNYHTDWSNKRIGLKFSSTKTRGFIKFISDLMFAIGNDATKKEFSNIWIFTEDEQHVLLSDLVGNQNEAINRVNEKGPVPAVIIGSLKKTYLDSEKNYLISHMTTHNGLKPFRIYVGKDRAEKERESLEKLRGQKIMIYGIASKLMWGENNYQLELYNTDRQIAIMNPGMIL